MKQFSRNRLSIAFSLAFSGSTCYGESPASPPVQSEVGAAESGDAGTGGITLQGLITPKLGYFSTSGGAGAGKTHFLERYDYRENTFGNNTRDGLIADIDFSLLYSDDLHDLLLLEREGFGGNNQRTRLAGNTDLVKFKAHYSVFTTATGGIDYLYNPDVVPGGTDPNYKAAGVTGESQHVGYFHNDSLGTTAYKVTRTNYGVSMALKPVAFEGRGSVELSYNGYQRDGNQVTNYVLPQSVISGSQSEANQWRGYSKAINEQDRNLAFSLTYIPRESWLVDYEFSVDKFENNASPVTLSTLSQWTGIPIGRRNPHFNGSADLPFHFDADSTQLTNSLRLSKQFDDSAVLGAGVSVSRLQQDNFTGPQLTSGYDTGKIGTDSAYLTGKFNVSQYVGLEAFWRYSKRENGSSYPVTGFYAPVSVRSEERMVAPRINNVETKTYGLEARLYPSLLKTRWTAGWTHVDTDRDLTYGVVPVVPAEMSLYGVRSSSDEVFVKLVARPAKGWSIRVTPSYLWSNQTGLVTEPEEALKLRTQLTYTKPELNELLVSGYYNYTDKKNGLLGHSDFNVTGAGGAGVSGATQAGVFGSPKMQQVRNTFQSGGINLSLVPAEDVKANFGYDWNQTDISTYYFSSNRLRYHYLSVPGSNILTSTDVLALDRAKSKIDTHSLSANVEKQWSQYLLAANYSLSWSKGQTGGGLAGQTLPAVDDAVDNLLHSLSLGMEYRVKKNVSVFGGLVVDYYKDNVYGELSGGRKTLVAGLSYRL
ncbi:MAG: hypothetical protein Q7T10_10455 [Rhodoferax sp.]|uniref:hypothetical protein n=1 Tax=Rhodoferax sp. TaxID=50421 RepID=UPI00271C608E|nr:hypothetical protein [Rhodoferax sp.]MDO8449211.1 hypothetical protein [Rhodoferax sp.]